MSDSAEFLLEHYSRRSPLSEQQILVLENLGAKKQAFEGPQLRGSILRSIGPHGEEDLAVLEHEALQAYKTDIAAASIYQSLALLYHLELHETRDDKVLASGHVLASMLRLSGDFEAARSLMSAVVELRSEVKAPSDRDLLSAINNLAVIQLDLDEPQSAAGALFPAIEVSLARYGPEDEETLRLKSNLGDALRSLGATKEAFRLEEEVLVIRTKNYGERDERVLTSMNNLAFTCLNLGLLTKARDLQIYVLSSREEILGPDHVDTITAMGNLAVTLYHLGDWAASAKLERKALEARRRVQGQNHYDTWTAENNLAGSLRDIGETAQAQELLEEVLQKRELADPEHHETLTAALNLADLLCMTGDFEKALELAGHVWQVRHRLNGMNHASTWTSRATVAAALFHLGRADEALSLQREITAWRLDNLGPEHFDSLLAENDLGKMLRDHGDLEGARNVFLSVFQRAEDALGKEHEDTITVQLNLLGVLMDLGDKIAVEELTGIAEHLREVPILSTGEFEQASRVFELLSRVKSIEGLLEFCSAVSARMRLTLELRSHNSLAIHLKHFDRFHAMWLTFCLSHAPDDLPAALIATHGLGTSAAVEEMLGEDGRSAVTAATRKAFQASLRNLDDVRVRLEEIDVQLSEFGNGLTSSDEIAKAELESSKKAFLLEERSELQVYENIKARLVHEDPALLDLLKPMQPTTNELAVKLEPADRLVLLWTSGINSYRATVITSTKTHQVELPRLRELMVSTLDYELLYSRREQGRGLRDQFHDSPLQSGPSPRRVAGDEVKEIRELQSLCKEVFWTPLLGLHPEGGRWLIVSSPRLHCLPFEAGNPGIEAHYFVGLPAYCRLSRISPSVSTDVGGKMRIVSDAAWDTPAAIPFSEAESNLIARLFPNAYQQDGFSLSVEIRHGLSPEPNRMMVACHGRQIGTAVSRYPVLILDYRRGLTLSPRQLRGLGRDLIEFYSAACVAALVSDSPTGDPLGLVSALQLQGVSFVIACSAPVPDFYMPMLSALYWSERLQGIPPNKALRNAKSQLRSGKWPIAVVDATRQVYQKQIVRVLERARVAGADPSSNRRAFNYATSASHWLWPASLCDRYTDAPLVLSTLDHERFSMAYCEPGEREHVAQTIVENLLASRNSLPQETLEHICSFSVCFG